MKEQEQIAMQIAKRLMNARLERGWTRSLLAEKTDINIHTLKHFERTGKISLVRFIKLCDTLEFSEPFIRAFKPRARLHMAENTPEWEIK